MMETLKTVGKSEIRIDAREKVMGRALYPGDVYMDNMAYGYTLRSSIPCGEIKVDKSEAQKHPEVLHVFTAEDVTGNNHHGVIIKDHEVFCSKKVRRIGEPIAFIVAESYEAAKEAAKSVNIEYKELPAIFDPAEAMKDDAPRVHDDKENLIFHFKLRNGDIERGFKNSDIIIENNYESSMAEHGFLQPEAGVAYIDENGSLSLIAATQYPHYDRDEIAQALDLPQGKIRIITSAVGGAFGGREDITLQIHLALAAYKLKRPVKAIYSREESFIAHSKRHPFHMRYKTGVKKDGTLMAMEAEIIGDSGAHASWAINVLRKAGVHATGPYMVPNVKVDCYAVYTNNPFTGAMRGFGAAQVAMAYEQQIDEIARRINISPIDLRLKNCFKPGRRTATGQILEESAPLEMMIKKAAEKIGYNISSEVRT